VLFHVSKPENEFGATWEKPEDTTRFMVGRSGDFLVFPFQCDLCWFYNLEKRSPKANSYSDELLLAYIRRVNLDGMWARSPSTVNSVRTSIIAMLRSWRELGVQPDLPSLGPWPVSDRVGFRLALAELKLSQRPGKNRGTHLQFDTIRKLRTAYSHVHESSASSVLALVNSFRNQLGKVFTNSNSPTQSLLFTRFQYGMLLRTGRQTKHNVALDYLILHKILEKLDKGFVEDDLSPEKLR